MGQIHHQLLGIVGVFQVIMSVVQSAPREYHLITSEKTWTAAKEECEKQYTDLAVVISQRDWIKFHIEAQSKGLSRNAWIGLYNDITSWRWSFNNVTLAMNVWLPGQPDNAGGHQSCGSVDASGWWWDDDCTTLKPFVCFDAKYNDSSKYVWISTPPMTWRGAQVYCRANYTDLASVNSTADNNLLIAKVKSSSWFGLFRDSWKWVDGTTASSISWINGEPNNYWHTESCSYYQQSNGQVGDWPCNSAFFFFCHSTSPATIRQTVKVTVKTDQNINDPELQSSILEEMQQKLEELGMTDNATLSWVEQDGNIFHAKRAEEVESVENTTQTVCVP
ncbi:putative C-type lectin domain family 20 member A [Brachyhypopomus gauderio]|uniref:putative C-type lectin domain family 20 member A n=1 Tax=Brachyhypopomus gauderio TaxID=698409 RepID=UPI0040439265